MQNEESDDEQFHLNIKYWIKNISRNLGKQKYTSQKQQ